MNDFISKAPKYVSGFKFTRCLGYLFLILSMAIYAFATQFLLITLINTLPEDRLLYVFATALGICWFGSLFLIAKWFRFYQTYKPGFGSLSLSVLPLFIIPLIWGAYELIKLLEVWYQ